MKSAHGIRGTAIPETAMVLTATLAMIFGIIQIGIIGFLQIMVDGAAFVAAHEYALGNTTYLPVVKRPFPQLGSVYIDQNNPDPTSVAVNYNTTVTTQRHGGVSLVRSSHLQATVTQNAPGGLLGVGIAALSNIQIHGAAIEPDNLVSNNAYDVDADGYGGTPSGQDNYYANVQNAPANYISSHEMAICTSVNFGAKCANGSVAIRSLGTAVFLDHDNWQRANLGVGTYGAGYTFGELLGHQLLYAAAASIFVPVYAAANLPAGINTALTTGPTAVIGKIYSWDYLTSLGGGYTFNETAYGLSPMHPQLYCP